MNVANGGCLKFEDEFIQRCMTIIGGASQHLNMVWSHIINNCAISNLSRVISTLVVNWLVF